MLISNDPDFVCSQLERDPSQKLHINMLTFHMRWALYLDWWLTIQTEVSCLSAYFIIFIPSITTDFNQYLCVVFVVFRKQIEFYLNPNETICICSRKKDTWNLLWKFLCQRKEGNCHYGNNVISPNFLV